MTVHVYVTALAAFDAPVVPEAGPVVEQVAAGAFIAPDPERTQLPLPVGAGKGPWVSVGVTVAVNVNVAGLLAVAGFVELAKLTVGVFLATATVFEDDVRVTAL